jgi:hypothetical protein
MFFILILEGSKLDELTIAESLHLILDKIETY